MFILLMLGIIGEESKLLTWSLMNVTLISLKANKTSPSFSLELEGQLIKSAFSKYINVFVHKCKGKTSQTAIKNKSILHTTGTFKQILVSI